MPSPLVSVVMPVYNCQQFLPQAIESILNQTYKNFELIIIDDGSTDRSFSIMQDYARRDKRIRVFRNRENLNQSKSINKILKVLKGEYFVKFDSDDVSHPEKIEKQVKLLLKNKEIGLVGTQLEIINEKNQVIGYRNYPLNDKDIREMIFYKSPFAHPSICVRSELIKKIGYPTNFKTVEDYLLWFKLLKITKGENLKEYLLRYRIRKNQIKKTKIKTQLQETITVQKLIFQQSQKIPLKAYFYHFLHKLLLFLPPQLILWLFMKIEYKKRP